MAGPDRIEWHRRFPYRALGRLGWYIGLAGFVVAATYVLFGGEPERLESGQPNPLAVVPVGVAVLGGLGAIPFLLALVRRPVLAADHYALRVRPGILRTLLLPWAHLVRVAACGDRADPVLMIRCAQRPDRQGDTPQWWDRWVLRTATRTGRRRGGTAAAYDIAVRMTEFTGEPAGQLDTLAAFAPEHVAVADELFD